MKKVIFQVKDRKDGLVTLTSELFCSKSDCKEFEIGKQLNNQEELWWLLRRGYRVVFNPK